MNAIMASAKPAAMYDCSQQSPPPARPVPVDTPKTRPSNANQSDGTKTPIASQNKHLSTGPVADDVTKSEVEAPNKARGDEKADIQWLTSIDEASKLAKAGQRGFVICFTSAATDTTIVFNEKVNLAMRAAGIQEFVKLDQSAENGQIFRQYSLRAGTLVLCSPDGSVLRSFSGSECSEQVISSYLSKVYTSALAVWLDTHR